LADIQRDAVSFSWDLPDHDGGAPISAYIVEKYDIRKGRWTRLEKIDPASKSYSARNLITDNQYYFRIMAENQSGFGEPLELERPVVPKSPYSKYTIDKVMTSFMDHATNYKPHLLKKPSTISNDVVNSEHFEQI
jgi:titin